MQFITQYQNKRCMCLSSHVFRISYMHYKTICIFNELLHQSGMFSVIDIGLLLLSLIHDLYYAYIIYILYWILLYLSFKHKSEFRFTCIMVQYSILVPFWVVNYITLYLFYLFIYVHEKAYQLFFLQYIYL